MLSRLKTALRALLRRSQAERELDDELRYQIERQIKQNVRLGVNQEEARQSALKSFGGVEQAKGRGCDARGVRWLEDLWRELSYGWRMFMRIAHHVHLPTLLITLGFGTVYAQPSTFDQLSLLYNYQPSTPTDLAQTALDHRTRRQI